MKRLTSLVLALLLALTMMVGAFAETADVTGEWYGELLGIQVTLTINADGTYKMDIQDGHCGHGFGGRRLGKE